MRNPKNITCHKALKYLVQIWGDVSQRFISGSVRLLHHDGDPDGAVRVKHSLAQVGEQVSIVAV